MGYKRDKVEDIVRRMEHVEFYQRLDPFQLRGQIDMRSSQRMRKETMCIKKTLAFFALLGALFVSGFTAAHAGGGAGFYQHFNGTVKFFPQGNNGQAWTFLYTSPPPVVVPPVVVPPVVTPPPVTPPPTTTPPKGEPTKAAEPKQGGKSTLQRVLRTAIIAGIVVITAIVFYCLATEDENDTDEDRFCKRTPEPVDEYEYALAINTTNVYYRVW
jgi:hypothetical protein